jgi:hypothetical protein
LEARILTNGFELILRDFLPSVSFARQLFDEVPAGRNSNGYFAYRFFLLAGCALFFVALAPTRSESR